jgi:hypothetical protein
MDARYRLAPMREVRARDERLKRGDLAGAVGDAHALAAEVAQVASRVVSARAAIAAATATRDRMLAEGAAGATLVRLEHYLGRRRRELEAVRGELLRAEARHHGQLDAVTAARGRLTLARADREIIERHFAAWRAARRKLVERRDD